MINPKSLANLRPRCGSGVIKETLKVRLPDWCKDWLKETCASYKIEVLIEVFLKMYLLLEKIQHNYSGYRVNGFTKGMRDLQEIAELLEEIK